MEKIDFKKQNIPFTMVANGVLQDVNLSLESKGLYAFMYSKPEGWDFSAERIGQELNLSKPTILNYLEELRQKGYLISQRLSSGRMLYKLIYPPINPQSKNLTMAEKPQSKKATVKKSHGEESLPVSNKEGESNKEEEKNKDYGTSEFIFLFKEINPSYKVLFSRKNQHEASRRLLEREGQERLRKIIKFIEQRRVDKFCPQIATPIQLEEKWSALEKYALGLKGEINKFKVAF